MSASITPETPEGVAWLLYNAILGKEIDSAKIDKEYILSTYSECLKAAKGFYKSKNEQDKLDKRPMVRSLAGAGDWQP